MTYVNHRDTETHRTHGVSLGRAGMHPGAGAHPNVPTPFLCAFSVHFVSLWLTSVIK